MYRNALALVLLSVPLARAQNPASAPPKLGRPDDFSNLVGTFQVAAQAQPTAVAVEEPVLVTVTITGQAIEPYVPKLKELRLFPDNVQRSFFVEPVGEERTADAWIVRYRLRPKHVNVKFVPGLKLCRAALALGPETSTEGLIKKALSG